MLVIRHSPYKVVFTQIMLFLSSATLHELVCVYGVVALHDWYCTKRDCVIRLKYMLTFSVSFFDCWMTLDGRWCCQTICGRPDIARSMQLLDDGVQHRVVARIGETGASCYNFHSKSIFTKICKLEIFCLCYSVIIFL